MLKIRKIEKLSIVLAWVLYMGLAIFILICLAQSQAYGFNFGRFTFKWDMPQDVDKVIFQVYYTDPKGKTGDYEVLLNSDRTHYTDDFAFGWTYQIKIIPAKSGVRGQAWVTYTVKPGPKVASQSITF